jgi:hypothetical protein
VRAGAVGRGACVRRRVARGSGRSVRRSERRPIPNRRWCVGRSCAVAGRGGSVGVKGSWMAPWGRATESPPYSRASRRAQETNRESLGGWQKGCKPPPPPRSGLVQLGAGARALARMIRARAPARVIDSAAAVVSAFAVPLPKTTLPGLEPGPSTDGMSPNGQGGEALPHVDSTASPALSMRVWETCRLSSRLQGVGRPLAAQTCPCLELAAASLRVSFPRLRGKAPVPERQHAASACLPRHRDSGIAAGCQVVDVRNTGVRRPALPGQIISRASPL